jgi:toxin YoeB
MTHIYQIQWLEEAKSDLAFWLKNDKSMVKRIEHLVENIAISPEAGLGKPARLKHKLNGYWSRRINLEHRLIYKISTDTREVWIISCKGHYGI